MIVSELSELCHLSCVEQSTPWYFAKAALY